MRRAWAASVSVAIAVVVGVLSGVMIVPGVAFAAPGGTPSPGPSGTPTPPVTTSSRIQSILFPAIVVLLLIGYGAIMRQRRKDREIRRSGPHPMDPEEARGMRGLGGLGNTRLRDYIAEEERRLREENAQLPEPSDPRKLPGEEDNPPHR